MRIGAHYSVAGSFEKAAVEAHAAGANTLQIFTASPRMWHSAPPSTTDVANFRKARERLDLHPLVIHDNYLINLASADPGIRAKSIAAFRSEMLRAILVDADYLVAHPGSYKGQTLETAIDAIARGLMEASQGVPENRVTLLLENTAGQGSSVGSRVEELEAIAAMVDGKLPVRVGYCLDTCHCFAAGIDLVESAERLGFDKVAVIHSNDSKGAFGSRLDRHDNIGKGQIGEDAFRRMLTHPQLREKAFILETPFEQDGDDTRDMEALRRLAGLS